MILYNFEPNITLKLSQFIFYYNDEFFNSTKIVSPPKPEEILSVQNENSTFELANNLNYNFKDFNNQNKIINVNFQHVYKAVDNFKSINANQIDKNIHINEYKFDASYTYLFNRYKYVVLSLNQDLNFMNQQVQTNMTSLYYQPYNSVKIKYGDILKLMDYTISLEKYTYWMLHKSHSNRTTYNKLLPSLTINLKSSGNTKYTFTYNKVASALTLQQLSSYSLSNDIFVRIDNYDVSPETNELVEFAFERVARGKNLFINMGYLNKKDVVENKFFDQQPPTLILQNVGSVYTYYINSRQQINALKNIKLLGYVNYNFSIQNSRIGNDLLTAKTELKEFNIGLEYLLKKGIDFLVTSGWSSNIRKYQFNSDSYKSNVYNSSIKFNYKMNEKSFLSLNSDLQLVRANSFNNLNNINLLINILFQRDFLKNKNLSLFLKINDLVNSGSISFQEYGSGLSLQSSKASTSGRYMLLGLSYKFNTLKR